MRNTKKALSIAIMMLLMAGVIGCGKTEKAADTAEPAVSAEAEAGTETAAVETVRQVGEQFEEVFMLDVEEKIKFEHIRNDEIGIEMDYPYELFERSSESDRECFVSVYDYAEVPEYYYDVTYKAEDAETVAASINEALSAEYILNKESRMLDHAGCCIWIGASEAIGGGSPEHLQEAWIIPAGDGCIVMTGHSGLDSADFFGAYYRYIANSIVVVDGN